MEQHARRMAERVQRINHVRLVSLALLVAGLACYGVRPGGTLVGIGLAITVTAAGAVLVILSCVDLTPEKSWSEDANARPIYHEGAPQLAGAIPADHALRRIMTMSDDDIEEAMRKLRGSF